MSFLILQEIAELQAEEVRTRNQRKIDMQKEKANKRAEYGELIRAKHSSPVGSPPRILPDVLVLKINFFKNCKEV